MRKTEKNKITITGVVSIEQILTVIGAHLEDIVEEFGAKAFCDIGFYFNSFNGVDKFTIARGQELLEHNYQGHQTQKKANKVNKKEELKNFEQKIPVNYQLIAERIPNMRLKIAENREKEKIELERLNKIKKEKEEIENKAIKKRNLISLLCEVVKNEHILKNGLSSSKGIKVWCIRNIATGMKHFPDINKNEMKVPFFLLTHDDEKFIYYKPEISFD
jgi:pterin-4a-carbinolamine dehydratase